MLVSAKEESKKENNHLLVLSDLCVCCGNPVPEGRQICWACEHQSSSNEVKIETKRTYNKQQLKEAEHRNT